MAIPRFIMAGVIVSVLLVSFAAAAEKPNVEPRLRDVISRLEKILQRLEQIEQRIARLESMLGPIELQPPDKHGILRDAKGRPVGIWGIDYPRRPRR
jgi:hypothetical protein